VFPLIFRQVNRGGGESYLFLYGQKQIKVSNKSIHQLLVAMHNSIKRLFGFQLQNICEKELFVNSVLLSARFLI